MSDVPNVPKEVVEQFAAAQAAAAGFGNMQDGNSRVFLDTQIPIGVYDLNLNVDLEKKGMEPGMLFPADLVECIIHAANNCGVGPMTMIRQHLSHALLTGEVKGQPFDLVELVPSEAKDLASIKRTAKDDAKEPQVIDQLAKMFLKDTSTWFQLTSRAKSAGISNLAALRLLVDRMVDGPVLRELIQDSKEAMIELEKLKKKKHMFQDMQGYIS